MEFKLLKEEDYTIDISKVKYRGNVSVPKNVVKETDENICEHGKGDIMYDETPYVKLYRPALIDKLGRPEFKLFCYIMEKMNRYNIVEIDVHNDEVYEYTGFKARTQIYGAIHILKDMSVIVKQTKMTGVWKVSEECMRKYISSRADDDKPFVKIYSPRLLMALDGRERALMHYICEKVDFEGVVKIEMHDYLDFSGYKHRNERDEMGKRKPEPNAVALSLAKNGLKRKRFIKDIALMVYDGEHAPRKGTYFRINPTIFYRGNRLADGHYNTTGGKTK